jgi:hypothetical protein
MAGFLRKLLRIGKLPADMRTQVESKAGLLLVPTRTLSFDVPPKFVYSVLGIPRG